jgi:DNA invertase Pin-like site-specific DNA recombinase
MPKLLKPAHRSHRAEFERALIRERVRAGIERAKADGVTLGRPSIEDSNAGEYEAIKAALAAKKGIHRRENDAADQSLNWQRVLTRRGGHQPQLACVSAQSLV